MERLAERVQSYAPLASVALNNTNITGRYVKADQAQRIRMTLIGGAAASTKTTKLEIVQATDAAGTGVKAVALATGTVTAEVAVSELVIALASLGAADTVTINGILFTQGTTSIPTRLFVDGAALVANVNDAVYGVPGVVASISTTNVTLRHDPDDMVHAGPITMVSADVGGTITSSTINSCVVVDLDVSKLDLANGFYWAAPKVTTTANTVVAVLTDLYGLRYQPAKMAGVTAVV